ncbi:MAG: redoxin domain-containing protein [Anaerolineales bacterium]
METPGQRDPWKYVLIGGAAAGVCLLLALCVEIFVWLGLSLSPRAASPSPQPVQQAQEPQVVHLGQVAPDFSLEMLGGERVRLSDYRGRAVMVNFWATWCGYCIEEMPLIQATQERYASQLVVLAVNQGENQQIVSQFVQERGYTFVVLLDPSYSLQHPYRVDGYPITYFIDASGIARHRVDGAMDNRDLQQGLQSVGIVSP